MIVIKSAEEIRQMREVGKIAAYILDEVGKAVRPGVTTEELHELCMELALKHDCYPSPLHYNARNPFPKSLCTSLNEVICHGIPSKKDKLKEGDIVNLDVTVYKGEFDAEDVRRHLKKNNKKDYFPHKHKGYHGDTNRTFLVGEVADKYKKLVDVTYEAMMRGIAAVKPGARTGDIGAAIQEYAESQGFSVVRDFTGHGIGRGFHEDPQIYHYGSPGTRTPIRKGMTFTVEPMINEGVWQCKMLSDGWTAITADRKRSAQFEHTLLVTDEGAEILTQL